jgi:hypothetical protein
VTAVSGRLVVVGPPDEDNTLVPVPADALVDWTHWIGWLTTALAQAAETTRFDLARHLPDGVDLAGLTGALDQASQRIGSLAGGQGWWPR